MKGGSNSKEEGKQAMSPLPSDVKESPPKGVIPSEEVDSASKHTSAAH